ncbi:MAG: 2-hydroxyglutaryl-CoA dehydratase [Ruminococcaceae bacterium]|nr:2-hydroxyglutaryl-CoA dehydratase [Oscillospiraceae bacterium]
MSLNGTPNAADGWKSLDATVPAAIGIDIGSTTAKLVVYCDGQLVYSCYERHFSQVRPKTLELLLRVRELVGDRPVRAAISGSAGLGMANSAGIPFVQEVFATGETVKRLEPDMSAVIELGGEDAKVIFFKGGMDERMNGSCAGGTGAFIDQMATLLDVTVEELDRLSLNATKIYPIASRCGVFAKTDIQPLLNQGAAKENIAASIYASVASQTIAGLAQGRKIEGKVMFLGGPLYFCQGLRKAFKDALKLDDEHAIFPEYARISVALGAAIYASALDSAVTMDELIAGVEASTRERLVAAHTGPLFESEEEYREFCARHSRASVKSVYPKDYSGNAYLGIDCGSTTTKLVLMSEDGEIVYSYYDSNRGNPVNIVKEQLREIYELCGDRIRIMGSCVTGYGEELIRHAFHIDAGLVETMAHFTAAKYFNPRVDFILDIGGQDIKCFKIKDDAIDSIMLNEACSSGCGSFIETFARSMGYEVDEFAKLGLVAKAPVELGTRCTVFMNSSVKQAQKDGATVGDISAGLSRSVVKNAIYKVIRVASAEELGEQIVVQGGTFLNDAVLRSFEMEIGHEVIRPQIAGLMGAFGAALYAKGLCLDKSTVLTADELKGFTHESRAARCHGCTNKCNITVNTFANGEKYISGNKCEKGAGIKSGDTELIPNLHKYKRDALFALEERSVDGGRGKLGLPMALGMYELAPLWHEIFTSLGFEVVLSGESRRSMYTKGQYSIPSDTACYPAKIMHGHIEALIEKGVDAIFYPCLTYNVDEHISDNHYNCPVVAYYSELLRGNMESIGDAGVDFLYPYLNINDERQFVNGLHKALKDRFGGFKRSEIKRAVSRGLKAYADWMADIRREGEAAIRWARAKGMRIMILAGRPYHVDPEIGHGIDRLAASLGFAVVTEDSIGGIAKAKKVHVLNQWTYHARLYAAAQYACEHDDVQLVQLVSFGCGIDAVTTDEVRAILESGGKLYTQIKIDEITNLGAVTIRLRSLIGALDYAKGKQKTAVAGASEREREEATV